MPDTFEDLRKNSPYRGFIIANDYSHIEAVLAQFLPAYPLTSHPISPSRSFLWSAHRSFCNALFCTCRIRSRVTPSFFPTSSSVCLLYTSPSPRDGLLSR